MVVGVLAFQGDVLEHHQALKNLGVESKDVRSIEEFRDVDALIIPGGESTVIGKFLEETKLGEAIIDRTKKEKFPLYGTCAGAILLAKEIVGDSSVTSLKLIDISVERNAYGRQTESFQETISLNLGSSTEEIVATFIRAPRIVRVGNTVEVLAMQNGDPVLCRQGSVLVSTFHPELLPELSAVHQLFLESNSSGLHL
ncbi:MAG TPA: pyridoxal 5'-phosphate synthase glutaminase subunit PdxT [Candidatus Peribacterales bacterium]|nr:pyridoxal 5'-phosphate synthase glutaminase subunit PdxT [Candidatus Peribacterales bacterium]